MMVGFQPFSRKSSKDGTIRRRNSYVILETIHHASDLITKRPIDYYATDSRNNPYTKFKN